MKKFSILGLCAVLILAVFAAPALAAVSVTSTFSETSPIFGGADQKASNPDLDDDDSDYNVYDTGVVRVYNNGVSAVTINSVSALYNLGFTESDMNISLVSAVTIAANSTADITLKARISEKLDAVNSEQKAAAFNIAAVTLKAGTATVATFNAYMQRKNMIEISDIDFEIGGETQSLKDDGDSIDDVKPGDSVKLTISAKNRFKSSDDIDIEADDGKWEIGGDIDEDDDLEFGDIGAGEEETLEFSFDVEDDVDDDEYDILVIAAGEDSFGAKHGQRIEGDFEVKKNNHEIRINSATISPATASCGESVAVEVSISNIGKNDEDEAAVRIYNEDLEIDSWKVDLSLDEGDDKKVVFDIAIPSEVDSTGSKAFTVVAYYDRSKETDRQTVSINIKSCEAEQPSAPAQANATAPSTSTGATAAAGAGVAEAQPTSGSTVPVTTVTGTSGQGFRDSTVYVLLLVLAIAAVVMAGAFIIAKLLIVK